MTVVVTLSKWGDYALLQSDFHWKWALEYGNKLETRPQYTPSDCFETFPFPACTNALTNIGEKYYHSRYSIMRDRAEGPTKIYNRFHDFCEMGVDLVELRRLHLEMDQTVAAAFGWLDLDLDHGFHETKQGVRYTISEAARLKILDRLLALNHERHAEEEAERSAHPAPAHKRGRKRKDGQRDLSIELALDLL